MEITEVRIKLVESSRERLRAFCSVTLDGDFVIRDLKIIDGANGEFVAMPSRKLMDRCSRCGAKNHLRARYCNDCGNQLSENRAPKDNQGRAKLHADVAHPINAVCRERVQKAVVEAYRAELEKAKSPDYKPPKFDDYDDYEEGSGEEATSVVAEKPAVNQQIPIRKPTNEQRLPIRTEPQNEPAPEIKTTVDDHKASFDDQFGDYNSLIADLKRDAQNRRERHREHHPVPSDFGEANPKPVTKQDNRNRSDSKDSVPAMVRPTPVPATRSAPPPPPAAKQTPQVEDDDAFSAGL